MQHKFSFLLICSPELYGSIFPHFRFDRQIFGSEEDDEHKTRTFIITLNCRSTAEIPTALRRLTEETRNRLFTLSDERSLGERIAYKECRMRLEAFIKVRKLIEEKSFGNMEDQPELIKYLKFNHWLDLAQYPPHVYLVADI